MSEFDNVTARNVDTIYGTTTIVHDKRDKLGITMAEYVVADFVAYANSKRKLVTFEYAYRRTGLKKDVIPGILKSLREKGLVEIDGQNLKVTRKWLDTFMIEAEWFESFWNVKGKPFWPGSKTDAKEKFIKACKFYSPEFLIQCRDNYIQFMSHSENSFRKTMGASVFLNLQTERFKEDWIGSLKRLKGEVKMPRSVTAELTKQEKDKLFQ